MHRSALEMHIKKQTKQQQKTVEKQRKRRREISLWPKSNSNLRVKALSTVNAGIVISLQEKKIKFIRLF